MCQSARPSGAKDAERYRVLEQGQLFLRGTLLFGLTILALPMIGSFRGCYGEAVRLRATTTQAMLLGFVAIALIDFYRYPLNFPVVLT